MKKFVLSILLLLTLHNVFSIEFRTIVFSDYFGNIEASTPYTSLRQRNYIRPEINIDLFDYTTSLTVSAEYYYDYFAEENTPDLSNILREAYLTLFLPLCDLTIGQKFTNKGKADVFSPLNIFNASYRELLSLDEPYQSKRPELTAEIKYYINDENSIELLYVPFSRPDYQGIGSINVLGYTLNKSSIPYLVDNPHSFYLTYNRYDYDFDLQITYGNYIDGNYNYLIDGNSISKTYNRVQTLGGALSTNLGSFLIAQEVAFNLTEDFNGTNIGVKNSDITSNTQVMHTLFGRTFAQINMIYQYIFNYKNSNDLSIAINDVHLQPTDNILFFIAHLHDYFFREKLYLALNVGFFFSTNVYLAPRVNFKFTDNITIETGIDMYTGIYANKLLERNLGGDNFFVRIKYEY